MANPAARKRSTSWIIAELFHNMSNLEYSHRRATYRSVLFPQPAVSVRSGNHPCKQNMEITEAYVSHGSTTTTRLISNLPICYSRRTILRFPYGVLSMRRGGSSKDREEKAKVGHPFGIGHLQWPFLSRWIRNRGGKNKRLILFTSSTIC
jgi:hypothetical protein